MDNPAQPPVQDPQKSASSETPPAPPKKSYGRNWKKLTAVYLLIAVVLYGAIYYFVLSKKGTSPVSQTYKTAPSTQPTPTPSDETANWKTYTSKDKSFSFNY